MQEFLTHNLVRYRKPSPKKPLVRVQTDKVRQGQSAMVTVSDELHKQIHSFLVGHSETPLEANRRLRLQSLTELPLKRTQLAWFVDKHGVVTFALGRPTERAHRSILAFSGCSVCAGIAKQETFLAGVDRVREIQAAISQSIIDHAWMVGYTKQLTERREWLGW